MRLQRSFKKNGFQTTLISGPTNLKIPDGVKAINVNSAIEMYERTIENLPVDVAVFGAAVADFKMKEIKSNKIKKENFEKLEIENFLMFGVLREFIVQNIQHKNL